MARRRMIDPNFWQSEDVSKLTIRQRLLLVGLFSNADDEGKLRGNPAFVRSAIYPYEDFTLKDIEDDLNNIEGIGSIVQYVIDSSKYIVLVNWKKFQRVDKPQRSVIPDLPIVVNNDSENDSENDSRPKEVKGKEVNTEEGKGSEDKEDLPAPFNHPLKDRIYNYSLKCELKGFNIVSADDIFYFFEKVEIEVIEHALKKSFQKHLNFAMKILNDWISEGKTTIDQVNPKSKVGDNIVPFSESVRQGSATGEVAKIEGKIGLLPSAFRADIEAAAAEWEANNVRKV